MKASVTVYVPEGVDPFSSLTSRPSRTKVQAFLQLLRAIIGGGILSRSGSGSSTRPSLVVGTAYANGTVTAAAVAGADTVTVNGTALTATQHHASGTVTPTTSGIDIDDTVTINGYAFTAKATEAIASGHFKADGTDAQCCTSLAACINGSTNVLISGIVTAKASATVVTVRAVTAGSGGNSITLASSDAQLAVSAATLANGASVAANQFDYLGSNAQTATALAAAVNASTTALIVNNVRAGNFAGTVTCASVSPGDTVQVAGVTFTCVGAASGKLDEFTNITSDTATAAALVVCINAHPATRELVFASNSSGVVTVRQLPHGYWTANALPLSSSHVTRLAVVAIAATAVVFLAAIPKGTSGNQATLASSDGTRLAVSGTRLTGGTSSTLTF